MLSAGGDAGHVTFDELAVAYRRDYLDLLRVEFGDASRQRGTLSVDEVRRYLAASVLPRLVSAGVIEPLPEPPDESAPLRITREFWHELADRREAARSELLAAAFDAHRAAEAPAQRVVGAGSTLGARGLVKSYRRRRVVNDVSLEVNEGEIVGLLGPNGAGKTTTFYMIVGLVRPEAGEIYLDDREISGLPMYQRARRGIGYLAQEPSIFRKLSVRDNVMAILETLPMSAAQRAERLESLLNDLSIAHLRDAKAYKLSGGERRRLEITRALVTDPKFLLLDEPFTGVDPIAVSDIQTIVAGLRRRGIGVLITDHNVEQTLDIVDRAYIMFEGRVQVAGTVRELVFNEQVADLYLGPTLTARLRERLGAGV
ncbi:MAG: LPS export ABC transporter ATP-binding protein [Gemmatimonadales bacterium]|nr:LPS export ABC transporter ATP-binding protein [Gemmatimonadales bacterium]